MWSASANGVEGFEWFIVILAFAFDLGAYARTRLAEALAGVLERKGNAYVVLADDHER
jgi:hypothetical protein